MTQSAALIDTLKQALRDRRMTYATVARRLGMSEANVKRMFSSRRFSLTRLEEICQLVQLELTDLVRLYEESRQRITELTLEQEGELVNDIKLLLVAVAVRNRLSLEEIIDYYRISKTECIRYLARLDRLKIIDLLPENRIRLRIDEAFRWIPNGPIERFFEKEVQSQFLKSHFKGDSERRLFMFGLMGEVSTQILLTRIQALSRDFTDLHRADAQLPFEARHSVGLMVAIRPWEFEAFRPLLRSREKDPR